MDPGSLRRLQLIQLDKERGELQEKLRVTGKRIDHFERALRREEIPLLNDDYNVQLAEESRLYEKNKQQKLAVAAARHKESVNLKRRLERILPDYQTYRSIIAEKRSEEFEGRQSDARNALEAEKAKRRSAFHKFQEEENRKREEREKQEQLETERRRREEEEANAKEETARKEAAEKARIREEERRCFNFVNVKMLITVESEMKFRRNKSNGNVK
jgi:translation initiation factor 3 subunit A